MLQIYLYVNGSNLKFGIEENDRRPCREPPSSAVSLCQIQLDCSQFLSTSGTVDLIRLGYVWCENDV